MYVYCAVCYPVIAAPYVRSVDCVFVHLYTLVNDSEHPWTMSSLYSLKIFPVHDCIVGNWKCQI